MKKLFLFILLGLLAQFLIADVYSTTYGGNWINPSTWIGGLVPGPGSNVQIQGPVYVNTTNECHNLTIQPGGLILNPNYDVGQVTVYGDCINFGQLVDSGIPGGELRMVILGNLMNSQTITCEYVYFAGDNPHTFSSYGTFSPTHFLNLQSAEVTFQSNVLLAGTHISLPHLNLTGYQINLSGGFMEHTNIVGGGGASLNLTNGAYLNFVTATEIMLQGSVLIVYGVTIGNLINNGTVYNLSDNDYSLIVTGRLDNHGTIGDNPGGHYLNLELQGDIYNFQTINPHYLTLGSSGIHDIWQSPTATAISAPLMASFSDYRMLSNLYFSGSEQDWNGHTITIHNGGGGYILNLIGGALTDVILDGAPGSTLNFSNNAWLGGVTADELVFSGTVLVGDGVEIQRLVNNGTLRGKSDNQHILMIGQRLENHGNIYNAPSGNFFMVNLFGDLINYGQITNYQFNLYGFADHYVLRSSGSNISCIGGFRLNSNIGWAQWLFNGILANADYTDFRTVNPAVSGVWNPYYSGLLGKNIIFGSTEPCPAPQNLSTQLIGSNLRLQWNQVPGAIYYTVYSASDPGGPFSPYPAKVFDLNPGDGIVWSEIAPAEAHRFFQVSAGN